MRSLAVLCGMAVCLQVGTNRTHAEPRRAAVVRIGGCSGVCVDPAGIVLTAKHCSLGEREVVAFPGREPVVAERIVIGPDAEDAVAFLLPPGDWPALSIAESVPVAGARVWSGGYPQQGGRLYRSTSGRIIGGGEHELRRDGVPVGRFLANDTDLVTGPGWSGGPLVTAEGEVIGLLSAGNAHGSTFVSAAATRRAYEAARRTLQAEEKPHLLVFGFTGCPHCETFLADHRSGRFDRFDMEYVDVRTTAGRQRYDSLRSALERATGTRPPDGFPAFHVAGRAAMTVGYASGDGWKRLLDWLRETLRLPVTSLDALLGHRDPGVSPDPRGPSPPATTPPATDGTIGPATPLPGNGTITGTPAPPFPDDGDSLPWWALLAGSAIRLIEERLTRGLYPATGEEVSA